MVTEVVQYEVHPQPEVVQEIHCEHVVLLPEHLDPEVEQLEVVPVQEDDRPVIRRRIPQGKFWGLKPKF